MKKKELLLFNWSTSCYAFFLYNPITNPLHCVHHRPPQRVSPDHTILRIITSAAQLALTIAQEKQAPAQLLIAIARDRIACDQTEEQTDGWAKDGRRDAAWMEGEGNGWIWLGSDKVDTTSIRPNMVGPLILFPYSSIGKSIFFVLQVLQKGDPHPSRLIWCKLTP